ncbi:MAG: hypothetical protein ACXW5U_18360 [Thermoanaerobaculia bacterium]
MLNTMCNLTRMDFAAPRTVRFTVEQIFLTDGRGQRAMHQPHYHRVEAETVDAALAEFLRSQSATLVGTVQKYPGDQAIATARTSDAVFSVTLLPGSDTFRRRS